MVVNVKFVRIQDMSYSALVFPDWKNFVKLHNSAWNGNKVGNNHILSSFFHYLLSYFKQNGNTTETIKTDHYTISKVPYIVIFKISHNVNNKQSTTQRINTCLWKLWQFKA